MATLTLARDEDNRQGDDRAVGVWLLGICAMIFVMAIIGAITRLTDSGLSIMEWAPITGILPPMSHAEWQRLFDLYRTIPQYEQVNAGMTLPEFKTIFWWEWIHRFWGRLIGIVFLAGFAWFLVRGKMREGLAAHLVVLFALGGLQGFVGWFMVESGFAERVSVSHYRLTMHLGLAFLVYVYALWLVIRLLAPEAPASAGAKSLRRGLWGFAGLVALAVLAGALVAGLNAGLSFNTFPLMDGRVVPAGYALYEPWLVNWFENPTAVQFNHRLLGVLTVAAALGLWLWARASGTTKSARRALALLFLAAAGQLTLGIATLVMVVPMSLATLHQGGAMIVLAATVWAFTRLRPAGPRTAEQRT